MNKNLELAKFVLERGTYFFGIDEFAKIDSASFFIDIIKQELGMFEKEIKAFVDLLEKLEIIDKVTYVPARTINPELSGYSYECEINVPKMKAFIKNGAGGATTFEPLKSCIAFGLSELPIPKESRQFSFCKKMYEQPADRWIDWAEIYDEMSGDFDPETTKWKAVYDVMTEINQKAEKALGIQGLFRYKKHEFLRTI